MIGNDEVSGSGRKEGTKERRDRVISGIDSGRQNNTNLVINKWMMRALIRPYRMGPPPPTVGSGSCIS